MHNQQSLRYFFSSNIFFYATDQAYDALNSLVIPLLHTWSLSVEEQFYIFFPFLIIFLFTKFQSKIIKILTIIIIISLIFSNLGSFFFESLNFYILPSRLWELLIGSVYFFYENDKKNEGKINNIKIFPLIGLFLILFSFIFINDKILHPSIITIVPIFGTLLILNFAEKRELVTGILSSKLFVAFGLISYSLYLWHYPIFAFSRIHLFGSGSIYAQLLVASSVVLLSIFTYFFIEKPFRNKKFIKRKYFFYIISIGLILLIVTSYKIISTDGFKQRVLKKDNYEFDNQSLSKEAINYTKKNTINIKFSKDEKSKILIVGDSHAGDLFNALHLNRKLFKDKEFIKASIEESFFLIDRNQKLLNDSDVIILSKNWKWLKNMDRYNDKEFKNEKYLIEIFNEFAIKNKKKFIIILQRPIFNFLDNGMTPIDNYLFIKRTQKIEWKKIKAKYSNKYYEMIKKNNINESLIKFIKKNNIEYLDPYEYTCNDIKKICDVLTEKNEKIFYDDNHYSLEGAKYFGKKISINNWFNLKD